MKRLIIFSMLLSAQVFACPSLVGAYKDCKQKDGSSSAHKIVITSTHHGNDTWLVFEEVDAVTKKHKQEKVKLNSHTELRASSDLVIKSHFYCENDGLVVDSNAFSGDRSVGSAKSTTVKKNDKLIVEAYGSIQGQVVQADIECESVTLSKK